MARLKVRCPGMTRKRRTRAAVALPDIIEEVEQEEGEKVNSGFSRLQEDTLAGRLPSLLDLWRSVEILDAWIPTRLPATPLITGWKTAISGYLTMTVLSILPPMLDITMADRTGVHPLVRISLVWGLSLALVAQTGRMRR